MQANSGVYGWPDWHRCNPESTDSSGPNGLTLRGVLSRMPYDPCFARHPVNGAQIVDQARRQGFPLHAPGLNLIFMISSRRRVFDSESTHQGVRNAGPY